MPRTSLRRAGASERGSTGTTQLPVPVTVNGDTADEPNENYFVDLTSPSNATLADGQGEGTILNDDTPADLSLTKTVDNSAPGEGDTIVFTITISYVGPQDALNVTVVDLLPTGLTFVSDIVTQGTYDPVTGVWSVGTLPPGGNATLTLMATVDLGTRGKAQSGV